MSHNHPGHDWSGSSAPSYPNQQPGQTGNTPPDPDGKVAASRRVLLPAVALLVFNPIFTLYSFSGAIVGVFRAVALFETDPSASGEAFAGVMFEGTSIVFGLMAIVGAVHMVRLRSWHLAVGGLICGAIPVLSPAWFLGFPLGIWGLVVLLDAKTKAAFGR